MTIYENRDAAMKRALEIKNEYHGAVISDGSISFCGLDKEGNHYEKKYSTLEVCYDRYDYLEGWIDCSATIIYKA